MTTIDGEAFVKGDAVIPESMIEKGIGRAYRGVFGSLQCFSMLGVLYIDRSSYHIILTVQSIMYGMGVDDAHTALVLVDCFGVQLMGNMRG